MKFLEKNSELDYRKVLSVCLAILLLMVGYEAIQFKKEMNFTKLEIVINKDAANRQLMNKADVLKLMREHLGFDPAVANLNEIDLRELEDALEENLFIQEAHLYLNARHELQVEITQRKPIARVKSAKYDYYVSRDGTKIPLSDYSTLRVPIITGYIDIINGNSKGSRAAYSKLVTLLNTCQDNKFLEALIEQIDIDQEGKFTIIPKLGTERIVFGDLNDQKEKLDKLKKYYKWGRKQDGWDKYAYLNLEYKNQIALGK